MPLGGFFVKKTISTLLTVVILVTSLCSCSFNDKTAATDGIFKVVMSTDLGGVNDQSFNQSAWEGLQRFGQKTGAKVSYSESKSTSDFYSSLDSLSDDETTDLIWAIGFVMSDALEATAKVNLDKNYAIVDYSYGDETPNNVTGVVFRAQESSFLVGYIAGMTTKTNKVGFVGGIKGDVISQFEYGYMAGIKYAAKEQGKDIQIVSQYAESFSDSAKGKAIATKMYNDGCDIIFHAAGGVGYGVFEAAKGQAERYVIGVDRDQSYLAPDNTLTSALKLVGNAMEIISEEAMNGKEIGGVTRSFGIQEKCVGIPENNKNISPEVYKAVMDLSQKIGIGTIKISENELTIPYNLETYKEYITAIK